MTDFRLKTDEDVAYAANYLSGDIQKAAIKERARRKKMCSGHYQHDCENCQFLEHSNGIDWYFCEKPNSIMNDFVGRVSDEPSDYLSGLVELWYKIKMQYIYRGKELEIGREMKMALDVIERHKLIPEERMKVLNREAKPFIPMAYLGTEVQKMIMKNL